MESVIKELDEIEQLVDRLRVKCLSLRATLNQPFVLQYPAVTSEIDKKGALETDQDPASRVREHVQLRSQAKKLQIEFNLFTAPHNSRVREYNRTRNPSVFHGLKRKVER